MSREIERMKTRKQKRLRRQSRKQKGGNKQIFLRFSSAANSKLVTLNLEKNETPRSLLQKYIESEEAYPTIRKNPILKDLSVENPPYKMKNSLSKPFLQLNKKWDQPYNFENEKTYFLFVDLTKTKQFQEQKEKKIAESYEVLRKVFAHYEIAKVILESAAITSDIYKNVKQQFKFGKSPRSPIVLIDFAFFDEEESPYEFYNYLQMEEEFHEEIGGREQVRFYKKKAGEEFKINPIPNPILSEEDKENYLAEVEKQGQGNLLGEFEICCVRHDLSFDKDPRFSIQALLKDYPDCKVYNFSD